MHVRSGNSPFCTLYYFCRGNFVSAWFTVLCLSVRENISKSYVWIFKKFIERWGQLTKLSGGLDHYSTRWLGGAMVGYQTCDREVVGSILGRFTIKRSLLGWVAVCGQLNHLST